MDWQDYDYYLPKKNLALTPVNLRDSSKLFVYNTKKDKIQFDYFYNLDKYLPKNSFLVLNNTKVIPARIILRKQTAGKVIALFLVNEPTKSQEIKIMADRKVNIGEKLFINDKYFFQVIDQKKHFFTLKYDFSKEKLFQLLRNYGAMPIPLYLKKSPLKRDQLFEKYQTIFAKNEGSAAAPTASLHFTKRVFKRLEKKGIEKFFITLHVGLGTFAPITEENLQLKKLHEEYYQVNEEVWKKINLLKSKGKKLVGVGTTVVRTIESEVQRRNFLTQLGPLHPKSAKNLSLSPFLKTDLFIFPPYDFKMIDILITNFHLPKSSLMMLVSAFLEYKKAKKSLVELYNIAIKNDFRFYSFGDAMLVI